MTGKLLTAIKEKQILIKVLLVLVFIVIGIGFLIYAKHKASTAVTYNHPLLNSPSLMFDQLTLILISVFNVLIFASHNITGSIYTWAILIGIPLLIAISRTKIPFRNFFIGQKWLLFFTVNGVILFICLVISNWVMVHGSAGKYFSIVFMSLWIALLLFIESTDSSRPALRKYTLIALIALGVVSCISPLFIPKHLPSAGSVLSELTTLDMFGLIGESSNAYLAASIDPSHIKATPHDKEFIRNFNSVKDVLKQKKIFLIRNGWLNSFPDTIRQFGILFQKTGEPFHKAGYELCRYQRFIKRTIFPIDTMQYQGTLMKDSTAYSGKTAMITIPFDTSRHFIYGPFIDLHKGKYTVIYRLKISRDLGMNNFAVLNISAYWGKLILTSRTLRLSDFAKSYNFEDFEVPLEINRDYKGVEFRIMYLGVTDLYFDRVVLIEL